MALGVIPGSSSAASRSSSGIRIAARAAALVVNKDGCRLAAPSLRLLEVLGRKTKKGFFEEVWAKEATAAALGLVSSEEEIFETSSESTSDNARDFLEWYCESISDNSPLLLKDVSCLLLPKVKSSSSKVLLLVFTCFRMSSGGCVNTL